MRNLFGDAPLQQKTALDPELELLERGKLEIQQFAHQQSLELEKHLRQLAAKEDDRLRRAELEQQFRLEQARAREDKQHEVMRKYNYLNHREF